MFLMMILWLKSLYPTANLSGLFCWALPRFLLLRCLWFSAKRKSGWGFAGRFGFDVFAVFFVFVSMLICHFLRTICVPV